MSERPRAVVTGASTGIGRACVAELLAAGWQVWATTRTEEDEKSLRAEHPEVEVLRLDVTDADAVRAAGERVAAAGPLHGLVNNAGIAVPGPLEYLPVDQFRRQIEVNLVGQLAVTSAMLPALRLARRPAARIVMIGSIGGRIAGPMLGPYHASKFGLVGLTDSLRAELAPAGIRVVLVEPGAIATPIWQRGSDAADALIGELPEEARQRYAKQIDSVRANARRAAARGLPPRRVATVVRKALTAPRPRPRYLVGPDAHAAAVVARLPYRLRYRLTAARR